VNCAIARPSRDRRPSRPFGTIRPPRRTRPDLTCAFGSAGFTHVQPIRPFKAAARVRIPLGVLAKALLRASQGAFGGAPRGRRDLNVT
jgi:hypothetical protein